MAGQVTINGINYRLLVVTLRLVTRYPRQTKLIEHGRDVLVLIFDRSVGPTDPCPQSFAVPGLDVASAGKLGIEHREIVRDNRVNFVGLPICPNLRFVDHARPGLDRGCHRSALHRTHTILCLIFSKYNPTSVFISKLAAACSQAGPTREALGLKSGDERGRGLPLIRPIIDHTSHDEQGGWIPQNHKNWHQPLYHGQDAMPPSLAEAIDAFLLACAIRCQRGQTNEHSSMLIHVTRFTAVQHAVHHQVEEEIRHMRQRVLRGIDHEPILDRLRTLWEEDFQPTAEQIRTTYPDLAIPSDAKWADIMAVLPNILPDVQVKMINGTAKDALDYADSQGAGLKVIAIGGDKLARGLTLEDLCVSYFLRASRMYDTLMQMGRWFGYRPG